MWEGMTGSTGPWWVAQGPGVYLQMWMTVPGPRVASSCAATAPEGTNAAATLATSSALTDVAVMVRRAVGCGRAAAIMVSGLWVAVVRRQGGSDPREVSD